MVKDGKKKGRDTPKHLNKLGPSQEKREAQLARHVGTVRIGAKTSAIVLDLLRQLEHEKEERLTEAAAARAAAPHEPKTKFEPEPEPESEVERDPDPDLSTDQERGPLLEPQQPGRPGHHIDKVMIPEAAKAAGFGRGRGRARGRSTAQHADDAAVGAGFGRGRGRGRGQPLPVAWGAPAPTAETTAAPSASMAQTSTGPRDPDDMPPPGLSQKERQEWLKRRTRKQEKDKARAARRGDPTPENVYPDAPTSNDKGGVGYAYRSSKYAGFDSSSSWTAATTLGRAKAAQAALIGDVQDDVGDMSAAQAKASQRRRATELKGKANLAAKERDRWVDEQSKKVMAKEAKASANEKLLKRLEKDSKKAEKDAEKVCRQQHSDFDFGPVLHDSSSTGGIFGCLDFGCLLVFVHLRHDSAKRRRPPTSSHKDRSLQPPAFGCRSPSTPRR